MSLDIAFTTTVSTDGWRFDFKQSNVYRHRLLPSAAAKHRENSYRSNISNKQSS